MQAESLLSSLCKKIKNKIWEVSGFPEVQFSSFQSLSRVRLFATHEFQHARPPCPSPTPGVHSDSRPSSRWCHPAISSSVIPFSSCPESLPASESFPLSQLFAWGGQSTGVSRNSRYSVKSGAAEQHTTDQVNRKEGAISFAWEK